MEDLLHLPRCKKKPVYTKGNVGKDTKKHEKKHLKKLKLQKLISLKLHQLCGTLTILIWGMI